MLKDCYVYVLLSTEKLDFKRGKTGSEIKLNNSGRQKKRTNKKQKHTPFRKILSSVPFLITSKTCDPSKNSHKYFLDNRRQEKNLTEGAWLNQFYQFSLNQFRCFILISEMMYIFKSYQWGKFICEYRYIYFIYIYLYLFIYYIFIKA